jgi:hypothetical protein
MKASARILITAATLAALTMLGLASTATASVPMPPEGPQHPTTTVEPTTVPHPGHGAQLHHDAAPATASPSPTNRTTSADSAFAPSIPALAVFGLLVGLAGATWLRRRH